MIGRFQFIALLQMLVLLGGMLAVWVYWTPQGEIQPVLWWVVEVVLGFFAFQALCALIMAGGMKKRFRNF